MAFTFTQRGEYQFQTKDLKEARTSILLCCVRSSFSLFCLFRHVYAVGQIDFIACFPSRLKSCADTKVTNKTLFPTFARTSLGPPEKISKSVIALLKAYQWRKFIIVSDTRQWNKEITLAIKVRRECKLRITSSVKLFPPFSQDLAGKNNLNVTDVKFFSDYIRAKYEVMQTIVDESFRKTRSKYELIKVLKCPFADCRFSPL